MTLSHWNSWYWVVFRWTSIFPWFYRKKVNHNIPMSIQCGQTTDWTMCLFYICHGVETSSLGVLLWHAIIILCFSMMTSSNGSISALLAICAGNSPVPGEFTAQRPVTRSFDVFFDLRLNKRLSKQSWGWWSETLSRSLWHHRNALVLFQEFSLSRIMPFCQVLVFWPFPQNQSWHLQS